MQSLLLILYLLLSVVASTKLISEQIEIYRELITSMDPKNPELNIQKLHFLMNLHDDDAKCSDACLQHIKQRFGNRSISWGSLREVVEDIYAGMVNDDPYEPQEVKLALTNDLDSMKVMYVR